MKLTCLICAASIAILFAIQTHASEGLSVHDFERAGLSGWGKETCCDHSVQVVTQPEPVRYGKKAVKFTLNRNDGTVAGSRRTEIRLKNAEVGKEYWYGWSLFFPADWVDDSMDELVTQWHGQPDLKQGDRWRSPVLALYIRGGSWHFKARHDAEFISKSNPKSRILYKAPIIKGKWTDFVVHVKWSFKDDGLLEIWQNGKKIVTQNGPNCFNDARGPYFKMGVYKWGWAGSGKSDTDKRVIYHDEVRVFGGPGGSFQAVSPPGAAVPPGLAARPRKPKKKTVRPVVVKKPAAPKRVADPEKLAAARTELLKRAIEGFTEEGRRPKKIFIQVFGRTARGTLVKMTPESFVADAMGVDTTNTWDKTEPKRIYGIVRHCLDPDKASDRYLLARFCAAALLDEQAAEEVQAVARLDADLGRKARGLFAQTQGAAN